MNNVLEQKRGFGRRTFTLLEDRILVETRESQKNSKFEVKLDQIGYDIYYQSESRMSSILLVGICMLVMLIFLGVLLFDKNSSISATIIFIIIMGSIMTLPVLIKRKDDIYITGGEQYLVFFRTVPNEEYVLSYIDKIITTSKQYLKKKYAVVDMYVPEEIFLNRLSWLLEKEIISRNEFEELKSDYITKKLFS